MSPLDLARIRADFEAAHASNGDRLMLAWASKWGLRLIGECERLTQAVAAHEARANYWKWQGDGEDHLESLACPVMIEARELKWIIEERDGMASEVNRLRLEHNPLRAELARLRQQPAGPWIAGPPKEPGSYWIITSTTGKPWLWTMPVGSKQWSGVLRHAGPLLPPAEPPAAAEPDTPTGDYTLPVPGHAEGAPEAAAEPRVMSTETRSDLDRVREIRDRIPPFTSFGGSGKMLMVSDVQWLCDLAEHLAQELAAVREQFRHAGDAWARETEKLTREPSNVAGLRSDDRAAGTSSVDVRELAEGILNGCGWRDPTGRLYGLVLDAVAAALAAERERAELAIGRNNMTGRELSQEVRDATKRWEAHIDATTLNANDCSPYWYRNKSGDCGWTTQHDEDAEALATAFIREVEPPTDQPAGAVPGNPETPAGVLMKSQSPSLGAPGSLPNTTNKAVAPAGLGPAEPQGWINCAVCGTAMRATMNDPKAPVLCYTCAKRAWGDDVEEPAPGPDAASPLHPASNVAGLRSDDRAAGTSSVDVRELDVRELAERLNANGTIDEIAAAIIAERQRADAAEELARKNVTDGIRERQATGREWLVALDPDGMIDDSLRTDDPDLEVFRHDYHGAEFVVVREVLPPTDQPAGAMGARPNDATPAEGSAALSAQVSPAPAGLPAEPPGPSVAKTTLRSDDGRPAVQLSAGLSRTRRAGTMADEQKGPPGMLCPACRAKTIVTDSRRGPNGTVRRRRECESCKDRFTTFEIVMNESIETIKTRLSNAADRLEQKAQRPRNLMETSE